ncbi:MAG TPA: Rieske 2Fe-2S domain-containing protein [Baekduia sp.]|nr:Rieske 2Fe-2S domain-containing protein [Baekduia sp.]
MGGDELEPGDVRAVDVDGLDVLVMRLFDGSYRAMRSRCLHMGARFSDGGRVERLRIAGDGQDHRLAEQCILRCPWHGFEIDVDTGVFVAEPTSRRHRTIAVALADGHVVLDLRPSRDATRSGAGADQLLVHELVHPVPAVLAPEA